MRGRPGQRRRCSLCRLPFSLGRSPKRNWGPTMETKLPSLSSWPSRVRSMTCLRAGILRGFSFIGLLFFFFLCFWVLLIFGSLVYRWTWFFIFIIKHLYFFGFLGYFFGLFFLDFWLWRVISRFLAFYFFWCAVGVKLLVGDWKVTGMCLD